MSDITKHIRHIPTIVEIERLKVESDVGLETGHFVRLNLVGNDIWVRGTPVWHDRMKLPNCVIRNVASGGIFQAGITISHRQKPYKIWIFLPDIANAHELESKNGLWNFIGFMQDDLADIDFVRNEAECLRKREELEEHDELPAKRPDKGQII